MVWGQGEGARILAGLSCGVWSYRKCHLRLASLFLPPSHLLPLFGQMQQEASGPGIQGDTV